MTTVPDVISMPPSRYARVYGGHARYVRQSEGGQEKKERVSLTSHSRFTAGVRNGNHNVQKDDHTIEADGAGTKSGHIATELT